MGDFFPDIKRRFVKLKSYQGNRTHQDFLMSLEFNALTAKLHVGSSCRNLLACAELEDSLLACINPLLTSTCKVFFSMLPLFAERQNWFLSSTADKPEHKKENQNKWDRNMAIVPIIAIVPVLQSRVPGLNVLDFCPCVFLEFPCSYQIINVWEIWFRNLLKKKKKKRSFPFDQKNTEKTQPTAWKEVVVKWGSASTPG